MQDAGCKMQDARSKKQEARSKKQEARSINRADWGKPVGAIFCAAAERKLS